MLNKAKPQESEECYWFFNKCRKQHQSGYQINRDKVNHACIHNKHVWFFPCFHWRHLLSAGLAQAINQASCMTVLCVRQTLTANRRKFRLFNSSLNPLEKNCKNVAAFIITTNKQTEYTARKSDTSFLILQRYFVILLWMLPSNSIYNFNFRSWMTSEGPTRKNLKKKLTNGRMPSCQKNRVSGNKNRVIRPTT